MKSLKVFACLLVAHSAFRHSPAEILASRSKRSGNAIDAKPASAVGSAAGSGRFRVKSRSTLPVNLLATSAAVSAQFSLHNAMLPGEEKDFSAALVWYDMHLTISEENQWSMINQVSWAVAKNSTAQVVSHTVGAGVTGTIGVHVGVGVAAALTVVVAAPVAIAVGIVAAGAVGVTTALAVSQLTGASFDLAALAMQKMLQEQRALPIGERVGNGLMRFCDVVRELDVRAAFVVSLALADINFTLTSKNPELALHKIVMTEATAEAYYEALQAKFSTSKLATKDVRAFEILGGFGLPKQHDSRPDLMVVDFTPLHVREAAPEYGCLVEDWSADTHHWRTMSAACVPHCKNEKSRLRLTTSQEKACVKECRGLLEKPRRAEERLFGSDSLKARVKELLNREGKVFVSSDKSQILRASRAAGIASDTEDARRVQSRGRSVEVKTWNPKGFTAKVLLGGSHNALPDYCEFPLEVLLHDRNGTAAFTEEDRALFLSSQFGQCWSRNPTNSWWDSARKVVAGGEWCHASENAPGRWCTDPHGNCPFHFGQVCVPNAERCGHVKNSPSFYCAAD